MTTFIPRRSASAATARPMPLAPPVMTATLPLMSTDRPPGAATERARQKSSIFPGHGAPCDSEAREDSPRVPGTGASRGSIGELRPWGLLHPTGAVAGVGLDIVARGRVRGRRVTAGGQAEAGCQNEGGR